jgi:hypothetical protein
MTSASLEDEREPAPEPPRRVAGPVLASVVLHGTLLYLVARLAVQQSEAPRNEERPAVRVIVETRMPGRAPAEAPAVEIPEAANSTPSESAVPAAPEPPNPESQSPPESPSAAADAGSNADAAPIAAPEAWTPARIRSAIEGHADERRSTSTATWLAECFVERKEHGTRDCNEQLQEQDYASDSMRAARAAGERAFARITRPERDWRRIEQFIRSNSQLEDLAEEGGVVGRIAADRMLLNNEYARYLMGNAQGWQQQDPLWQAMDSGFTADVLGGRRLSLPGNIPFRCGSGKAKYGVTPGGVGVSDIVPCVFEFTGFTIERPQAPVEANAFRVVPVVPGSEQFALPGATPENRVTP